MPQATMPQAEKQKATRESGFLYGAGTKSRTRDLLITSQLLYQLSYAGVKHGNKWLKLITLIVVPEPGIEPGTRGFSILCSTD